MKTRLISLFILLSLVANFLKANDYLDNNYSFGVIISKYDKIRQNKIKSVVTRISKQFQTLNEDNYFVDVTFLDNNKKLFDSYINYSKYNSIITYASFYLRDRKRLKESSQYYFTFDYNKEFQQYVLLVNNKSNIKSIRDLKGKNFSTFVANDNYSDWLDYITLKELHKPYKQIVKNIKEVQSDSTLVLDLYFNKSDFSVIRKSAYNDIVALNPAIKKRVSILKESKPIFLFGLGLMHKNVSKKIINGFDKIVKDGTFDKDYQSLLELLGNVKIKRIYPEDLFELEKFYDEYIELKRKY
ncbi:PhnD/SsuA/transferrin family substrate-binding protein [Halarcobacter sp.]|uniref:PhnD/SsuA/transferrin family substrate-binding protein n=1 Tax=Halarcobacter sp. TaxID=2321133 RepID=UPI002AA682DF|nr:PhnD/SsuA/transferrin family substrate-binding protein [Halarcobacter sp.]